jgi:hypothetical protein
MEALIANAVPERPTAGAHQPPPQPRLVRQLVAYAPPGLVSAFTICVFASDELLFAQMQGLLDHARALASQFASASRRR